MFGVLRVLLRVLDLSCDEFRVAVVGEASRRGGVVVECCESEGRDWDVWPDVVDAHAVFVECCCRGDCRDERWVFGPAASDGEGCVFWRIEHLSDLVECLDADIDGAVFEVDAVIALFPEFAEVVHGGVDGAIADGGDRHAAEEEGEDESSCFAVSSCEEELEESLVCFVGGHCSADDHVIEFWDAQGFRLDAHCAGFADEAEGFCELDPAVSAGSARSIEAACVGPPFEA